MILIYSHTSSARLQYTCSFIFTTLLGVEHRISIDQEAFLQYDGPKINYSSTDLPAFTIRNHHLLFDSGIEAQEINMEGTATDPYFFAMKGGDMPFDLFAATFYLISRYEEYGPHNKDEYGRYAHTNSLAYRSGFLDLPVVNQWAMQLAAKLADRSRGYVFNFPRFIFQPTYDIDIAYAYKHKGWVRNIGGFIKTPSRERISVLLGKTKDPFDCYAWLDDLHIRYSLNPTYFFLLAQKNGRYDKQILPHTDAMWTLVKGHAKKYAVGIHPSWQSGDDTSLIIQEKRQLEAMSNKVCTRSRQHYIRFDLPGTYRGLIDAGIDEDHSMGYGSINGFRASVASSFYWYDLEKEVQTNLRVHPFCFMDANAFYEQNYSVEQAYEQLLSYESICRRVRGPLVSIWHNNFLGNAGSFKGWGTMYEKFLAKR